MKSEIIAMDTPEMSAIEPSKADKIRATFEPMAAMLTAFEAEYEEIVTDVEFEITKDVTARARDLRLRISKVRIETEKIRKSEKEEYLRAGKAIDGVSNILKWAVTDKENRLKEIENHFEIMERKRLEALQERRAAMLSSYVEDAQDRDLSGMEDDVWAAYLAAKKKEHEDRLEAERQAEEERKAREKAEAEERERIRIENERLKKEAAERDRLEKIEAEKRRKLEAERIAKERVEREAHEAELRKERAEAERIRKEQEKERRKLESELKRKEQEAEALRLAQERKAREEAEAKAKAEAAARDEAHRAQVNRAAAAALISESDISEDQAAVIVMVVAAGKIPGMTINY